LTNPLLQADDLHAYYGSSHVVQGVSFETEHECLAILGRNGMGKTTLLRALLALSPPRRKGKIFFKGRDISVLAPYQIAQMGVGYVPQGRRLFPSLTVEEHLRVFYQPQKNDGYWTPEKVFELFPELQQRRKQSGSRLSGGEQQMLAISRALVTNPLLLVMDEPTEGLAPVAVNRVIETCIKLKETGIALLLVEQNLKTSERLSDRVCVMVAGSFIHQGPSREFFADTKIQRELLGV